MKNRNIHHHNRTETKRKPLPLSGILLVTLLLSTFLTVLVAEQQQENRSKAAAADPVQQACLPGSNLTQPEAGKLEPFCTTAPDATVCKDFCKRTETNGTSTSPLCKAGGVYSCEAASGKPAAGKCQTGACATSPRTGTNSYCGGGQTCCTAPQPVGGVCTKDADCETTLGCAAKACAKPVPGGNPKDIDGDGIPNAVDPNPEVKNPGGKGIDGKVYQAPGGPQGGAVKKGPAPKAPGCRGANQACHYTNECCGGLQCSLTSGSFGTCKSSVCMPSGQQYTSVIPCCSGRTQSLGGTLYCD